MINTNKYHIRFPKIGDKTKGGNAMDVTMM